MSYRERRNRWRSQVAEATMARDPDAFTANKLRERYTIMRDYAWTTDLDTHVFIVQRPGWGPYRVKVRSKALVREAVEAGVMPYRSLSREMNRIRMSDGEDFEEAAAKLDLIGRTPEVIPAFLTGIGHNTGHRAKLYGSRVYAKNEHDHYGIIETEGDKLLAIIRNRDDIVSGYADLRVQAVRVLVVLTCRRFSDPVVFGVTALDLNRSGLHLTGIPVKRWWADTTEPGNLPFPDHDWIKRNVTVRIFTRTTNGSFDAFKLPDPLYVEQFRAWGTVGHVLALNTTERRERWASRNIREPKWIGELREYLFRIVAPTE